MHKGMFYLGLADWFFEAPQLSFVGIYNPTTMGGYAGHSFEEIKPEQKREIYFRAMWPVVEVFPHLPFAAKLAVLGHALDFRKECEQNGVDWRPFHQQEYPYAILGGQKSHFEGTIYERLP